MVLAVKISRKLTLCFIAIITHQGQHGMCQNHIKTAWLCTEQPVFIGFSASNNLGALSFSLEIIANDTSVLSGYSFE